MRTTGTPAATESLLNELDLCVREADIPALDTAAQSNDPVPQSADSIAPTSGTQSIIQSSAQPAETSASQPEQARADEVPIGVLEIPVGVWGSRRGAFSSGQFGRIEVFSEETSTVIVFPHGAVIRLSSAVAPGQMMMVTNRDSNQVAACRVVKARNFPNTKGYAEVEFFRPANKFWGDYVPQGTMKLAAAPAPSAADRYADDFWNDAYSPEMINILANAKTASPVRFPAARNKMGPIGGRAKQIPSAERLAQLATPTLAPALVHAHQRGQSAGERSWIRDFLSSLPGQVVALSGADRNFSPKPKMVFAWVTVTCLLLMGATGMFLLHRGMPQIDTRAQAYPAPEAPDISLMPNAAQSAPLESNSSSGAPSVEPGVPVIAKTENFPGTQAREYGDNARTAQLSSRTSILARKMLNNSTPLVVPPVARRSSALLGKEAPPSMTGANSNPGTGAIPGFFSALLPTGGRVKEAQLVSKSAPNYPAMAKQSQIEGEVTVNAVIDITGKLTNIKVVSGSPLLQQAALDSLRTWKYEPALLNDKPVPVQTSITVKFRLR
ncbi:MAG: TonB family protein [Candidatus Acidiferrales bacterium]